MGKKNVKLFLNLFPFVMLSTSLGFLKQNQRTVDNKKWHPIHLTLCQTTKSHYAKIEKETIVFGVGHFHEYLYGCRFIVINYHKPFKSMFTWERYASFRQP